MAVKMWPTPTARDWRSDSSQQTDEELYGQKGRPLARTAQQWATPRATDGEKGGPNQAFGAGGMPLPAQASQWATPRVEMARALGNPKHITPARGNGNLEDQTSAFSLPAPETPTHGIPSSNTLLNSYLRIRATSDSALRSEMRTMLRWAIRSRVKPLKEQYPDLQVKLRVPLRRGWTRAVPTPYVRPSFRKSLNPHFVLWLMGWPPGWTSFACSETALSLYRQRLRSELLSLGLPRSAPPAQTLLLAE
jgi:hypothetical protein